MNWSETDICILLVVSMIQRERAVCVTNGRNTKVDALQSDHEEADSHMFVHTHHAMETFSPERVVLWSTDIHVAIMCPYHVFKCNIAALQDWSQPMSMIYSNAFSCKKSWKDFVRCSTSYSCIKWL